MMSFYAYSVNVHATTQIYLYLSCSEIITMNDASRHIALLF